MGSTFVVIGGDAAGMSAASKAKREAPDLEVVVFERGDWVSYGACGLPYYVKGDIASLEDLVAVPAEDFREERDIDLRTGHEVVGIDPTAKTVTVEADDGTVEQSYDDLLIATGAHAIVPPIDGADLDGVFSIHDLPHGRRIREFLTGDAAVPHPDDATEPALRTYLDEHAPETVGVIGGGYVGLEMAEAFHAHGLDVQLFEMLPHVLAPFGNEVAPVVEDHLRDQGVDLHLETTVERIQGTDGRASGIRAADETVDVDMVLVGVGVAPNVALAEDAGIETGPTGAIATDEYGRTSVANVYAAGDCAEVHNHVTGGPDFVPLALTANRHGRAIGQSVVGTPTPVGAIVGSAVVKVFDLEVARTGVVDPKEAEEAGYDPVSRTISAPSRAHYYPGGSEITVHMQADAGSGRLLGTAMVGREGVAHRINTVATALHNDMTVPAVEQLDLAYAPPFGPVWDPVLTGARVLAGDLPVETTPPAADD